LKMLDVVIPTKNCASDLEECLSSLKAQVEPVRIIVVDAHSTDGTRDVVNRYGATLVDEPSSDVKGSRRAVACNEGLRHSTSRYVAFLDADVVVPPMWSKDMMEYFGCESVSKVAAVTSGCITNPRSALGREIARVIKIGSTHAHQFERTTMVESVPGYNSVYLREALDEVGGFNEYLGGAEDWELNYRLRKEGWILLGVPRSPVVHKERPTLWSFATQMYGYGWSRARLFTKARILTPKHALPTFGLILSLLFCAAAPAWGFFALSLGLAGVAIISPSAKFPVVFMVFLLSWALGYLVGLAD